MAEIKWTNEEPDQVKIRDSILDNLNAAIYVSDMVTNEILFANLPLRKLHGSEQLAGKICWEALWDREKRCENCSIPYLLKHPGKGLQREMCAEGGGIQIYDCIIPWAKGKLAHLQCLIEIIEREAVKYEKTQK